MHLVFPYLSTSCGITLEYLKQPIVDAERKIIGYEILTRAHSANIEQVLSRASEADLLGILLSQMDHVSKVAVADEFNWSFNLDSRLLYSKTAIHIIARMSQEQSFRRVLEVTENWPLPETQTLHNSLNALKVAGAKIYQDDYGSGFASKVFENFIDFQGIKLDRSLIERLDSECARKELTEIRDYYDNRNIKIVVEGIESKATYITLKNLGFGRFHGYYFGRPTALLEPKKGSCLILDPIPIHAARAVTRRIMRIVYDAVDCCCGVSRNKANNSTSRQFISAQMHFTSTANLHGRNPSGRKGASDFRLQFVCTERPNQ